MGCAPVAGLEVSPQGVLLPDPVLHTRQALRWSRGQSRGYRTDSHAEVTRTVTRARRLNDSRRVSHATGPARAGGRTLKSSRQWTVTFISHKLFLPFCKIQSPHKLVKTFVMLVIVKQKLVNFWGNCLLQNDSGNTFCEIRAPSRPRPKTA